MISAVSTTAKKFSRYLIALCLLTLVLMCLGAGTRAKKFGITCPDWPLCFGKIIPDFHPGVYWEFIHRSAAGTMTILFLGCLIFAWRSKDKSLERTRGWLFIAFPLLLAQILMGGLTVLRLADIIIVTGHLTLATLFFGCLFWGLLWITQPKPIRDLSPALKFCVQALPALIFCQIVLGGLVASSYAGSVCVDFPLCNGQWIPEPFSGPIALQVIHRFMAYFIFVVVMGSCGKILFSSQNQYVRKSAILVMAAVLTQVCLGIANVHFLIPFQVTVAHHLVGILLLATSLRLAHSQA